MELYRRQTGSPGLVYLVAKNGRVTEARALGLANVELSAPMRRDSVLEIGSITKMFTVGAVLLMVQDGKLNLDEPVGTYVPDLPAKWKPVTLRHALSHTAGLKDYLANFQSTIVTPVRPEDIYNRVGPMELDFAAGSSWSYSNTGYLIATAVVERVSQKKLHEFLQERVFEPLKMKDTRPSDPTMIIPRRARGYALAGRSLTNAMPINPTLGSGAGYLVSTVDDMLKWDTALRRGTLLKDAALRAMFTEYLLTNGSGSGYGLGWFAQMDRGRTVWEHGGNTYGFSANILHAPNGVTIITLTNGAGHGPAGVNRRVLAMVDRSYDPSKRNEPDPDPSMTARASYVFRQWGRGRYDETNISPEMRARLNTTRGLGERGALTALGRQMKVLRYLDGEPIPGGRLNRYALVTTTGAEVLFEITFDREGKLRSMSRVYLLG